MPAQIPKYKEGNGEDSPARNEILSQLKAHEVARHFVEEVLTRAWGVEANSEPKIFDFYNRKKENIKKTHIANARIRFLKLVRKRMLPREPQCLIFGSR